MSIATSLPFPTIFPFSNGVSAESNLLNRYLNEARKHNASTVTLGWRGQLISEIEDIYTECALPSWDGYDAAPISKPIKEAADFFVDLLPENIYIPAISPEANGNIAFEWNIGKSDILSISISDRGIIFAGIFGNGKKYSGKVAISDELPQEIEKLLSKYFSSQRIAA